MDREELLKCENHTMKCRKCGEVYKYFEVVKYMDSCDLPDGLVCIEACKNCGELDYDEIN